MKTNIPLHELLFDWGLGATSLFNTILLVWLGLTVLLNAEKRDWGTRLAGCGMLLGGLFFLIHTATLDYSWEALIRGIRWWWYICWLCVLALPFGWYVLMLWYSGAWDSATVRAVPAFRSHRIGLGIAGALGIVLAALVIIADPARLFQQIAYREGDTPAVRGIPLLLGVLPLYLLACISFSLDALRHTDLPQGAGRALDDVARRRARPWLMASTGVQLVASLMVGALLLWIVWCVHRKLDDALFFRLSVAVSLSDFVISALVGVAVVLMGKAIVSYEIFTGKTLPRRGFLRQWRNIVGVAAAYSILVSLFWALPVAQVYLVLLSTILLSVFFALFSWRGYVEREHYVAQLRPFVASQGLYEQLLETGAGDAPPLDAATPFRALCDDVLGVQAAYLVPIGPLAPLVGAPLVFPPERGVGAPPLSEITPRLSPKTLCIALDSARTGGLTWAVPLWSERGLIGVLLLGDKRDGGLFTQEEIEIARAGCERLIDTQASAALARQLMALQRRHVAQTQMLDRRARRVLHDDVLPRLHAVLLTFADAPPEALAQLSDAHREISNLLREMPGATTPVVARLGLVEALRQCVSDEHPGAFDAVEFAIEPAAERAARELPPLAAETLFFAAREAVRNAAKHARPSPEHTAPLHLLVALQAGEALQLCVEDNGIGLENAPAAEARGGSGQGLALHGAMLAILGGTLELMPRVGGGTRVVFLLPHDS